MRHTTMQAKRRTAAVAEAGRVTTVGLDVGDRHSVLCVPDERGEIVEGGRVPTTPSALERRFRGMPPARVAPETGAYSPWISRLLAEFGHEVIVGDARRLRLLAAHRG